MGKHPTLNSSVLISSKQQWSTEIKELHSNCEQQKCKISVEILLSSYWEWMYAVSFVWHIVALQGHTSLTLCLCVSLQLSHKHMLLLAQCLNIRTPLTQTDLAVTRWTCRASRSSNMKSSLTHFIARTFNSWKKGAKRHGAHAARWLKSFYRWPFSNIVPCCPATTQ